jgi:hypothetical protein
MRGMSKRPLQRAIEAARPRRRSRAGIVGLAFAFNANDMVQFPALRDQRNRSALLPPTTMWQMGGRARLCDQLNLISQAAKMMVEPVVHFALRFISR